MRDSELTLRSGASGVAADGAPAVCVTENCWRPSLVAGERLSGPDHGSIEVFSQLLSPKDRGRMQSKIPLDTIKRVKIICQHFVPASYACYVFPITKKGSKLEIEF